MATNILKTVNISTTGGSGGAPYVAAFNATTSWGSPVAGYYSIVIAQSAHLKGIDPVIQVYETVLTNDELIDVDTITVNEFGDVTIRVTSTIDTRFAGKIVIK